MFSYGITTGYIKIFRERTVFFKPGDYFPTGLIFAVERTSGIAVIRLKYFCSRKDFSINGETFIKKSVLQEVVDNFSSKS